jgi:hypothetical protein
MGWIDEYAMVVTEEDLYHDSRVKFARFQGSVEIRGSFSNKKKPLCASASPLREDN